MGRGSSKVAGGGGGAGAGGATKPNIVQPTATWQDNSAFDSAVRDAVSNSNVNINTAVPAIQRAMDDAPVGVKLSFYNSNGTTDAYTKIADGAWIMEHIPGRGMNWQAWSTQASAADLFNAMANKMGLL